VTPFSITFDVGIGDFINAESFWSPEKKAALETVHHAWINHGSSPALIAAMQACPAFRHVRHVELLYPTQAVPGAFPTLRDHAVSHRLKYHGSAFLASTLEVEVPNFIQPPTDILSDFIYIQHSTPKNGPGCQRFITDLEWAPIIARLEDRGCYGLVVNSQGGRSTIPEHPRLIDWTGRTTFPQAIEILKRARGYIGVDSCLAILAAQLFKPADLWIRTQNPYLYETPWFTYPPLTDFSFLCPRFDRPNYSDDRPVPKPGQLIELRCNALVGSRNFGWQSRVEVEPGRAADMIAAGQAVAMDPGELA
jgi:hypothetical protein